jgi:hypothetical protein
VKRAKHPGVKWRLARRPARMARKAPQATQDFWTAIISGVPAMAVGFGDMGRRVLWEAQTLGARFLRQPTPSCDQPCLTHLCTRPLYALPPFVVQSRAVPVKWSPAQPGPLSPSPIFGPGLLAAVALEHPHGAPVAGIKHLPNQRRLLAARTTCPGRIGFEAGKDFVFKLVAHDLCPAAESLPSYKRTNCSLPARRERA